MSLELINNLLELSEKHMNEGDYNQVAMLLKEKYKIIDDIDYETMLIVPPIEIFTNKNKLLTVKGFKYKKSLKTHLCNGDCKCLTGEFLLQVGEQELCIKSFFSFINVIIDNELLNELSIENSFYGKVKKFNILDYILLYKDLEINENDDDYDINFSVLFNTYVKTQFINICENTIRQTILLLFRSM